MKIKVLAVLGLATVAGLAGCRGATNTNTNTAVVTNTNTGTNTITMATPMSTPMATKDTAVETAVKSALDKAGIRDVTVDATSAVVTLRGTVAKGKMAEAYRIATETSKRKVDNQLTEK